MEKIIEFNSWTIMICRKKYLFKYKNTEIDFKNWKFLSSINKKGAYDIITKFAFNGKTLYNLNKFNFSQMVGYPVTFVDYAISLKRYSLVLAFMKFRLTLILESLDKNDIKGYVCAFSEDKIAFDETVMSEEDREVKLLYELVWVEIFVFLKQHKVDWGNYIDKSMISLVKKYKPSLQEKFCIKLNRNELNYSNLMMTLYLLRMWKRIYFHDVGRIYVSINDFTHNFFRGKSIEIKHIILENLYIYLV